LGQTRPSFKGRWRAWRAGQSGGERVRRQCPVQRSVGRCPPSVKARNPSVPQHRQVATSRCEPIAPSQHGFRGCFKHSGGAGWLDRPTARSLVLNRWGIGQVQLLRALADRKQSRLHFTMVLFSGYLKNLTRALYWFWGCTSAFRRQAPGPGHRHQAGSRLQDSGVSHTGRSRATRSSPRQAFGQGCCPLRLFLVASSACSAGRCIAS